MSYKIDSWWDLLFYILGAVIVVAICAGITFLFVNGLQNKMDGGLIIDKYIIEGHYEWYSYYNANQKRTSIGRRWISTKYILVVQKEIKDKVRIKEVPVSIEKYYNSEIGEIYHKK